jgi:putative hemolysin
VSAPPEIAVKKGELRLRLAKGEAEVRACQRLRFRVFYDERGAVADSDAARASLDADRFDPICDHLVVVREGDKAAGDSVCLADGELVGTYRLLRQEVAERNGGFYTQHEFDVAPMIAAHPTFRFLELGRSCVLAPYRTKPVVELLWQGIWNYVRRHRIDVMFGCASLEGTEPAAHQMALGYLAGYKPAPPEWRIAALPGRRVDMEPTGLADPKAALRVLPPLIKGYLRLGCYVGDGAVIDRQFNTIDVLIVLPVQAINPRYFAHFGQPND